MVPPTNSSQCRQSRLVNHNPGKPIKHACLYREFAYFDLMLSVLIFWETATALGKLGHPEGELNLTRAAAKHGVIQMVCMYISLCMHYR